MSLNTYSPLVKLNHKNIGTIRLSNLGTEIVEYLAPDEVAIYNLALIALHTFIGADKKYDFSKLYAVTKVITANLNWVIDVNYYPVPESNFCHHPIGIGIQDLADAFTVL